jgi:hypothetical protein
MTCVADRHFKAIVLIDPAGTTTQRVELVAETWEDARAALHARFGIDSVVDLMSVEDAERPR